MGRWFQICVFRRPLLIDRVILSMRSAIFSNKMTYAGNGLSSLYSKKQQQHHAVFGNNFLLHSLILILIIFFFTFFLIPFTCYSSPPCTLTTHHSHSLLLKTRGHIYATNPSHHIHPLPLMHRAPSCLPSRILYC